MQDEKAKFHELHLVVDEDLRYTLQELMQEIAGRSLSKFLSGILKLLYPWLEHEHLFGKERQARVDFQPEKGYVCADKWFRDTYGKNQYSFST